MGLRGHLTPKSKLRPTVFDLRVGAPFIVQTRLHWLAYRRWHQTLSRRSISGAQTTVPPTFARELLVVQIVGNSDDLSSPLNQVDIAIERPDNSTPPTDRRFFFLEMKRSTHEQAIKFACNPEGPYRRELFMAALTEPPEELARRASDPTLLVDYLPPIEPFVTDAVFVMHGIRDDGFWTSRIAKQVKEHTPKACVVRARTPTYGYFAMLPFLLPWIRRQKVEWFMDQYVAARAQYPNAEISFVGHSNGTYLAACALHNYAEARFKNIFFAGSVVRKDYPWLKLIRDGRVQRFHNVRAARDWVVALLPKSVEWLKILDLGGGGFDGFNDVGRHPSITQPKEFADGMHSAALVESQWGHIADFAVNGTEPPPKPDDAFVSKPSCWLKLLADTHCGIPVLLLVGLVILPGLLVWLFWNNPVLLTLALVIYVLLLKFVITRV
jgi:pimeloyl-ACP methyl ester carboxylesterase